MTFKKLVEIVLANLPMIGPWVRDNLLKGSWFTTLLGTGAMIGAYATAGGVLLMQAVYWLDGNPDTLHDPEVLKEAAKTLGIGTWLGAWGVAAKDKDVSTEEQRAADSKPTKAPSIEEQNRIREEWAKIDQALSEKEGKRDALES